MTRPSAAPPVSLAQRQSDRPSPSDRLYTILPRLSGCPTSHHLHDTPTSPSDHPPPSRHLYDTPTHPSDHPPPSHRLYDTPLSPSACPSPADCLTATTTRPPVCPSFPTIHHTHDSSQSLAVVNGEQSRTIHCTQDSSQSLAVVNGEQSRKSKKFHRPLLTTTYFYVPKMPLASTYVTSDMYLHLNQGRMLTLHVASVILVELP